ncbi:restriction endonuclease subunit S [Bacillus sp. ISL-37]|uniref:restriction endonuclease subunit S n=1 Tax=Bacillus sp. ISL-37 TaxID=2819123 RepID=UPI001BEBA6DE|nr:restriction endonuclease subunit S [Bacillus sp. ISL-37]MBT2685063.1 restriction endonuclease subunit S [Bacillus sp. ISL-37]
MSLQELKLKYYCEVKDGTHDTPQYVDVSDNTFPLVTSKDITNGILSFDNAKHISYEDYLAINKRSNVEKYDVIMPMIGTVGNPAIVLTDEPFSIKNVALFKTSPDWLKAKYLKYILDSSYIKEQFSLNSRGGVQSFVSLTVLENLIILMPKELKSVISYLDDKTKKIDALIDSKVKLINLLEQQRQSIITEAVTKGLNSNVKMKDSGVEWIGEIPEHWEVKALKYCFKVGNGKEIELEIDKEDESGVNVYGSGGIFKKTDKILFVGESVLFGRKGTIGKPLYVNDAFWTVDTMYYTKFYKDTCPKWFYYLLLIYPWNLILTQTALPSVVGTDVANTICGIPPLKEQIEIANHLTLIDDNFHRLKNSINNQIAKLKEYRQSLIYEAVTGKIDVSDMELD